MAESLPDLTGMDALLSSKAIGMLPSGKPVMRNPDGSISTHRNTIANFGKDFYIIPTLYGGKQYTPDDAINFIKQKNFVDPDTGQQLPAYKSLEEAQAVETQQHGILDEIARMLSKGQRVP